MKSKDKAFLLKLFLPVISFLLVLIIHDLVFQKETPVKHEDWSLTPKYEIYFNPLKFGIDFKAIQIIQYEDKMEIELKDHSHILIYRKPLPYDPSQNRTKLCQAMIQTIYEKPINSSERPLTLYNEFVPQEGIVVYKIDTENRITNQEYEIFDADSQEYYAYLVLDKEYVYMLFFQNKVGENIALSDVISPLVRLTLQHAEPLKDQQTIPPTAKPITSIPLAHRFMAYSFQDPPEIPQRRVSIIPPYRTPLEAELLYLKGILIANKLEAASYYGSKQNFIQDLVAAGIPYEMAESIWYSRH